MNFNKLLPRNNILPQESSLAEGQIHPTDFNIAFSTCLQYLIRRWHDHPVPVGRTIPI